METPQHATLPELESALPDILKSPRDHGSVLLISRRPSTGERELLEEATLDLEIGTVVLEITAPPHLGCGKFATRFGADAIKFVNSHERRSSRLRGVNSNTVQAGTIRRGDRVNVVRKVTGSL